MLRRATDSFFFFQAEDGIRDTSVTGVQTCALPISRSSTAPSSPRERTAARVASASGPSPRITQRRSEERRVGKECRSGWAPYCEQRYERRDQRGRMQAHIGEQSRALSYCTV